MRKRLPYWESAIVPDLAAGQTVLIAGAHARRFRILKTVRTDSFGRWGLRSSVRAAKWRVRWTSPTGVRYQGPPIGAS